MPNNLDTSLFFQLNLAKPVYSIQLLGCMLVSGVRSSFSKVEAMISGMRLNQELWENLQKIHQRMSPERL